MDSLSKVTEEALTWPELALRCQVATVEEFCEAAHMLQDIKAMRKKVEEVFGPHVKDTHAAWRSGLQLRKRAEDPLKEAEDVLKGRLSLFRESLKQRTAEAQQQMEADAKKVAKAQGIEVPVVLLETALPTVEGLTFTDTWKVTVDSDEAFFKAAMRDKNLRPFLKVDAAMLQRHVNSVKGEFAVKGISVTHAERVSARASGD
jgi:hypothetical protein